MSIACKKCGSRDTVVTKFKDLKETVAGMNAASAAGAIGPAAIPLLIAGLEALKAMFGWLERREANNPTVIVCRACGHLEKP